ncbi:MAG: response regulator [Mariprofundus sp.]|nr:response regulator [Mariprofundus sp.]
MERPRLMLAEDDGALASILEEYLVNAGYDVVVYRRGDLALAALQEGSFDLILADVVMPGADGLSLLNFVRENSSDTLVLLMTGFSSIEDALLAVKQGAYDFVSKPFQLPEIRIRLDNAARYQQLMRLWKQKTGKLERLEGSYHGNDMAAVRAYGRQNDEEGR